MGKKLTLYLIDGTDNGPRTIEIGNWSGKAIHSPRVSLFELLKRDEYSRPGVYILKSDATNGLFEERIYIGESENIRNRLKQHLNDPNRDFKECIVFISKDELLTKSHIKYLESKLISNANDAKNSEIENIAQPIINTLSEADISDMEYFLDQIRLILPTVGFEFLHSMKANKFNDNYSVKDILSADLVFSIKGKKVSAQMIESSDGFIVLKGSQTTLETSKSINEGWIQLRNKLIATEKLKKEGEYFIFQEDTLFSSTSAAAAVVLGRQAAGPLEWVDENNKSYKEYQNERLNLLNGNLE